MGDFSYRPHFPLDACHAVDASDLLFGSWEDGVANRAKDRNQGKQATGIAYSAGEPPSTVGAAMAEALEQGRSVCRDFEAEGHDSVRDSNAGK